MHLGRQSLMPKRRHQAPVRPLSWKWRRRTLPLPGSMESIQDEADQVLVRTRGRILASARTADSLRYGSRYRELHQAFDPGSADRFRLRSRSRFTRGDGRAIALTFDPWGRVPAWRYPWSSRPGTARLARAASSPACRHRRAVPGRRTPSKSSWRRQRPAPPESDRGSPGRGAV